MIFEWRRAGGGRWGRVSNLADEARVRAWLTEQYGPVEVRPHIARARGRPAGSVGKSNLSVRLPMVRITPTQLHNLEARPGKTLADKLRLMLS